MTSKIKSRTIASALALAACCSSPVQAEMQMSDFEAEYFANVNAPGALVFNPPEAWHVAAKDLLPKHVEILVVGKGNHEFPPSISLGIDEFGGTLREYLKKMKDFNDSEDAEWKELGTVTTQAGQASLSQVDCKSEWGELRMMHALLLKEGKAYIFTAAALKEEFSKFYKDFFTSMRSLRFNPSGNEEHEQQGEKAD